MMPSHRMRYLRIVTCVFGLSLGCSAAPSPGEYEETLTRFLVHVMTWRHHLQQPLDDRRTAIVFERYLNALDPHRLYFLESDIEAFRPGTETLDDDLVNGELEFVFAVFDRFVMRVSNRVGHAARVLEQPLPFAPHETVILTRDSWAQDEAAWDERWRLELKHAYLEQLLTYETVQGEGAAIPQQRIVNDVMAQYERFLRQLRRYDASDVMEVFLNAVMEAYDPNSGYAAAISRFWDLETPVMARASIGVYLGLSGGAPVVAGLIAGGPAALDGRLRVGDRLISITSQGHWPIQVAGMPLASVRALLTGVRDSRVLLHLSRREGGKRVETHVDLVRDHIIVTRSPTSERLQEPKSDFGSGDAVVRKLNLDTILAAMPYEPQDRAHPVSMKRVLAIAITEFTDQLPTRPEVGCGDELTRFVQRFGERPPEGLILDLRSNLGGDLDEAIKVAGLFFKSIPIAVLETPDSPPEVLHDRDARALYTGPLVVLVNRFTASAAEVVAAAIQDTGRGIVIGDENTFGKGTVQFVTPIWAIAEAYPVLMRQNPGTLQVTTSQIFRLNGDSLQLRGVTPDIRFPSFRDHERIGERFKPNPLPSRQRAALASRGTVDVRRHIKVLQRLAGERRKRDQMYPKRVALIDAYAQRQGAPPALTHAALRTFKQQRLEWSAKVAAMEQVGGNDFLLTQAVEVLQDLMRLEQGRRPINPQSGLSPLR